MKSFRFCAAFLALLGASACTRATAQEEAKSPLAQSSIENCASAGGLVERVGMLGEPACVIPTPDAGKACRSSSDCAGKCFIETATIEMGDKAQGRCQADNMPFGCHAEVENGRVATPFICVD